MGDTLKLRLLSSDQVSTMREKCLYLLATHGHEDRPRRRARHPGRAPAPTSTARRTSCSFPVDLVEAALATRPRAS